MEREIRYCTTDDGERIADCTIGSGAPVIWHGPFIDQMSAWFTAPDFERRRRSLPGRRIIRYDGRGTGMSQRDVSDFSLDARVRDMAAVVRALDLETFDLMGNLWSAPVVLAYAARYPGSVRRLLLMRAFRRGKDVAPPARFESLVQLCRTNWPLACEVFYGLANPREALARPFEQLLIDSADGATVATWLEQQYDVDVSSLLPLVTQPALVVHCRDDRAVRLSLGQDLAAHLPDARLLALPSNNYDTQEAMGRTGDFFIADNVDEHHEPGKAERDQFRTILFTDLVGHTGMMQRLGDARGRDVLREHERITRETLRQHGGTEVKTMGDGFMASFGSVTSAMACAVALQRGFSAWNERGNAAVDAPLHVRVGLNAGEPIEEDGDLFGAAVILASRVCAQAGAGEILVPEPVRHLLAGKDFVFADRGEAMLKGFEDAVRLFEVRWRE
jgi:class 3 adenylate cyclase/pimeloyl-ACP methyl ester carboxylesterase